MIESFPDKMNPGPKRQPQGGRRSRVDESRRHRRYSQTATGRYLLPKVFEIKMPQ
jgi:hypothetical protein